MQHNAGESNAVQEVNRCVVAKTTKTCPVKNFVV